MSEQSEFVDGVFVKVVETKYGEIIKQSFECEKFIEFMRANAKKSDNNGKWYFNAEILTAKEGSKKYMKVDNFVPQPQSAPPVQQPPVQQEPQLAPQSPVIQQAPVPVIQDEDSIPF